MTKISSSHFDIVIVGGGMAGSSMALFLAQNGLNVAVVERNSYQKAQQASFDDRCIALSWSSKKIFQKMGMWSLLENPQPDKDGNTEEVLEAILDIHISDQGKMGSTRLSSQEENVSALGYVVESRAIGNVLTKQVAEQKNITLYCPAELKSMQFDDEQATLELFYRKKAKQLTASLVIAADGAKSFAHQFLAEQPQITPYGQTAVIANVETQFPHNNVAYERFTPTGPLAMLPLTRNRCSLVWTVNEQQVEEILGYSDKEFLNGLQQNFGYRLGNITRTGKRFAYPLSLMKVDPHAAKQCQRLLFVGNAAHSIHPVAGQGFNLGLRDILVLAELIKRNVVQNRGQFSYQAELIGQFWDQREADINRVGQITNSLIKIFSNNQFPWTPSRNVGLILADIIPPIKHKIARQAMGMDALGIQ